MMIGKEEKSKSQEEIDFIKVRAITSSWMLSWGMRMEAEEEEKKHE